MKHYTVTVAIPAYNRVELLTRAIASVLRQTYEPTEILVVDNNSSDDLYSAVGSFNDSRIRYVRNDENIGMVPNWNRCLSLAQGDIINILHSDDELLPNSVQRAIDAFMEDESIGLVCTVVTSASIGLQAGPAATRYLVENVVSPVSSAFIKRRCIDVCGVYSVCYPYTADQEFFPRIARHFSVGTLADLVFERDHEGRSMIDTWRRTDFFLQFGSVRKAAWALTDEHPKSVYLAIRNELFGCCCYIYRYLIEHTSIDADRDISLRYLRLSTRYLLDNPSDIFTVQGVRILVARLTHLVNVGIAAHLLPRDFHQK